MFRRLCTLHRNQGAAEQARYTGIRGRLNKTWITCSGPLQLLVHTPPVGQAGGWCRPQRVSGVAPGKGTFSFCTGAGGPRRWALALSRDTCRQCGLYTVILGEALHNFWNAAAQQSSVSKTGY